MVDNEDGILDKPYCMCEDCRAELDMQASLFFGVGQTIAMLKNQKIPIPAPTEISTRRGLLLYLKPWVKELNDLLQEVEPLE